MSIHREPLPEFGGLGSSPDIDDSPYNVTQQDMGIFGADNAHDPTLDDEGIAGQHELAQRGLMLGPEEDPES